MLLGERSRLPEDDSYLLTQLDDVGIGIGNVLAVQENAAGGVRHAVEERPSMRSTARTAASHPPQPDGPIMRMMPAFCRQAMVMFCRAFAAPCNRENLRMATITSAG